MPIEAKAGFKGIVTATGELASGQGALRVADNVTLRKEGALTLRQFFTSTARARAYLATVAYKGVLYYFGPNNALYNQNEVLLQLDGASPPAVRADIVGAAKEARGNLYIASSEGIYKMRSTAGSPVAAGRRRNAAFYGGTTVATGTPLILANNTQVAYRLVSKHTDTNGVIVRSRPTGASVIQNTTGAAAAPQVTIAINSTDQIDEVEVYRTRVFPTTAAVDDELQLVAKIPFSQFVGPGYPLLYTLIDRVLDTARGTTLYTSPSRGGMENAADRPPGAACLERFRSCLFFANIKSPHRVTVSAKWAAAAAITGSATGRGIRVATGNTTSGSPTVTNVSPTTGLQVGMYLQSTPITGLVTAINGSTFTVDANATATTPGATLQFSDRIHVRAGSTTNHALPQRSVSDASLGYLLAWSEIAPYDITPPSPGYDVTTVIEAVKRGGSPFYVTATHGEEYDPPLPAYGSTSMPSTFDDLPHGLMWSEPDEPEHVPPKNFARVGDAGKAILALVATRDRLLIFKEDGLFMLTGDTSRNFAIYPLDTTCLCILPGSVRRLQNSVYALTNLGLVVVDENGAVSVVSRPIQNEIAPSVTAIRQAHKASGLYLMPGLTGATGSSDDANGEYWMMLGTTTPSFGGQVLVWNAFQGGFTTHSFTTTPVALGQTTEGQPLVLTSNSELAPATTFGTITARISPHGFSDPALVGKMWTHIVAAFSQLTGTTSVTAKFTSSESMSAAAAITEQIEAPTEAGTNLVQLPLGSLLRHPIPRAMARAFLSFVELTVAVTSGTFTLDALGAEDRANIPNKRPSHGTGAT